jgi:enoyl-CoA hydratase/carnithine racemase
VLAGEGKFFSNGLDLEWLAQADDQARRENLARVYELLLRLLEFPGPVAAAMNGHSFGAGAMMALACDWRAMRSDRGFFCLPEIDIGLVFVPGMNALITAKLSGRAARDSMLTGRRFDGPAAEASGIVDAVAPEEGVVEAAAGLVSPLAAKSGEVFAGIRRGMYGAAIDALLAEARTAREG